MDYDEVLALIQAEIVANGNNEITADVLRPILEAILQQPNDLIGDLDDLETSEVDNLVAAINSILSANLPNSTVLYPIDTTGIDFDQDELLWVRDAVNQTATNNGAFTCNVGQQIVFYVDTLLDMEGDEATIKRRYYRLTSGETSVSSLGSGDNPPLMPDGSSNNVLDLTGDLIIDLGDIGTDDVEDAFNSDASEPFTISGDKFVKAVQDSENKLWLWIGGDGDFGNSATLATDSDFVDLTGATSPPLYDQGLEDVISVDPNATSVPNFQGGVNVGQDAGDVPAVITLRGGTSGSHNLIVISSTTGAAFSHPTAIGFASDSFNLSGGQVRFDDYGDGTHTGTVTKLLAVDADGYIIETDEPSGGGSSTQYIMRNLSDLVTDLTVGTSVDYFRMPFGGTLSDVSCSLLNAGTSTGVSIDILKDGVSILSTELTTDATEKTSTTATTAAVISDTSLPYDSEITFDITGVPTGGKGLMVTLEIEPV